MLQFNPTNQKHKNIQGAICEKDKLILRFDYAGEYVKVRLYSDKTNNVRYFDAVKSESEFLVEIENLEVGLYYYHLITDSGIYVPNEFLDSVLGDIYNEGFQLLVYKEGYSTPNWLKGGIIYQIFPDRFNSSNKNFIVGEGKVKRNWGELPHYLPNDKGKILNNDFFGGDLKGIEKKAKYLKDLGVTALYLNPITLAFSNHRYDTSNYLEIDNLLGDDNDFKSLCKTLNDNGIKVILDGVYNHTGDDSVYFNKYGKFNELGAYQSKDSKYFNWFTFQDYPNKYTCWWDIDILPTINKNSVEFEDYITQKVIPKYLNLGANGFRLDVVDELPSNFVKKIRKAIKSHNDEGILIGEVWEDATNKIAYGSRREYFQGQELDSVMNYPLKNAIIDYLKCKDANSIKKVVLQQINNYPKKSLDLLMNILDTHDTSRILTVLGKDKIPNTRQEMVNCKLTQLEREMGLELLKLAVVLQFTLYGVPSVYYGDEIGLEGAKDPFNRKCFNWNFDDFANNIKDFYKKIGKIRKENKEFIDGTCNIIFAEKGVFAFARKLNNSEIIIVVNASEYNYNIKCKKGLINLFDGTSNTKYTIGKNGFLILKPKC